MVAMHMLKLMVFECMVGTDFYKAIEECVWARYCVREAKNV